MARMVDEDIFCRWKHLMCELVAHLHKLTLKQVPIDFCILRPTHWMKIERENAESFYALMHEPPQMFSPELWTTMALHTQCTYGRECHL